MFNRLGVLACGCATDYCFLYSRSTGWWLLRPPGARKGQEMRAAKLCCRGERCEAWGEPSRQSRRGCLAGIDIDSMLPSVCCRLLQYNPLALVRSCAGSPEQAVNATATQPPHGLNDPQTAWDKAIVSTWNDGFARPVCVVSTIMPQIFRPPSATSKHTHSLPTWRVFRPCASVTSVLTNSNSTLLISCDQSPGKIHVGWGWLCQLCGVPERQGYRNTHAPASRTCEMVKALTSQCTATNLLKKSRIIALIDSSPS